jgi:hypothetical protein
LRELRRSREVLPERVGASDAAGESCGRPYKPWSKPTRDCNDSNEVASSPAETGRCGCELDDEATAESRRKTVQGQAEEGVTRNGGGEPVDAENAEALGDEEDRRYQKDGIR